VNKILVTNSRHLKSNPETLL